MTTSSIIEVMFRDGTKGRVAPKVLDVFLHADKVFSFKRATGRVTVGIDPMRARKKYADHKGPEKRTIRLFRPFSLAS